MEIQITEGEIEVCTWLREISSCSCLTVLPGPAWVLLSKTKQTFISPSVQFQVGILLEHGPCSKRIQIWNCFWERVPHHNNAHRWKGTLTSLRMTSDFPFSISYFSLPQFSVPNVAYFGAKNLSRRVSLCGFATDASLFFNSGNVCVRSPHHVPSFCQKNRRRNNDSFHWRLERAKFILQLSIVFLPTLPEMQPFLFSYLQQAAYCVTVADIYCSPRLIPPKLVW